MKSRLFLTTMIVLGAMMGGTGATLAVTGSSGQGNAATHQYRTDTQTAPRDNSNLGAEDTEGADEDSVPSGLDPGDTGVQDAEQVATAGDDDGSLPFTGLLAIPLMIGGVALVATGTVLRRKTRG